MRMAYCHGFCRGVAGACCSAPLFGGGSSRSAIVQLHIACGAVRLLRPRFASFRDRRTCCGTNCALHGSRGGCPPLARDQARRPAEASCSRPAIRVDHSNRQPRASEGMHRLADDPLPPFTFPLSPCHVLLSAISFCCSAAGTLVAYMRRSHAHSYWRAA